MHGDDGIEKNIISRNKPVLIGAEKARVRTGHGKPGKSWNLRISFSRPGK